VRAVLADDLRETGRVPLAQLKRGANVALTREIPGLAGLVLGVRWDAGRETVLDQNLVFAAVLCDERGRARSDADFVFFNQLASPELSVHQLEEALGGDHEQIEIDLRSVPAGIQRIVAVLYVNDGPGARRTLGQLRSLTVRVLNLADNAELIRSEDLAPALRDETALVLGEVYRHDGGWKFRVLGDGYAKGIAGIAADYGIGL
jgi:tellurium resistance protein TerD